MSDGRAEAVAGRGGPRAERTSGGRRRPPQDGRRPPIRAGAGLPGRCASRAPSSRAPPAGELGELFEYRISQPVTIRKDESAMLPFLQQAIDARKLLIYSTTGSEHPTNAAELTNSTGKTLDGGPITVYDGGAYGGEALMETLKARDKRLISYAVDLGTRITEAFDQKAAVVREIHAQSRHADREIWRPRRRARTPSATSTRRPRRSSSSILCARDTRC